MSCSQNSETNSIEVNPVEVVSENLDFKEFLDIIPTKNLPLTIECGFESTFNDYNFSAKQQKFIPNDFEVVGKLNTTKDLNLVLFAVNGDIIYPYLFSFDDNGQIIDSIYLHKSTCTGDPNLELSTWSVIDTDITINMTDTTKVFNYSETDNSRILESTVVKKRTVKMKNDGSFFIKSETTKTEDIEEPTL